MNNNRHQKRTQYHKDNQTNKTGFIGVKYKKRGNRYEAYIAAHDRVNSIYCGSGKTAAEAARKYDQKSIELYGPDAVTNFKQDGEQNE